jgi:hypothetical protein
MFDAAGFLCGISARWCFGVEGIGCCEPPGTLGLSRDWLLVADCPFGGRPIDSCQSLGQKHRQISPEALLHSFGRLGRMGHKRPSRIEKKLGSGRLFNGASPPSQPCFLTFVVWSESGPLQQSPCAKHLPGRRIVQRTHPSGCSVLRTAGGLKRARVGSGSAPPDRLDLTVLQPFLLPSDSARRRMP